ncbi:hypothetical protein STXM2123_621 [Streptomyces sp. F-3]|nr:hypothetical protein STXM2123_621 [Streptomyces sp. F-3]
MSAATDENALVTLVFTVSPDGRDRSVAGSEGEGRCGSG